MAETNKIVENFRATNGLNPSDLAALLTFKKAIGESLNQSPELLNTEHYSSANDVIHTDPKNPATSDPLDEAFLRVLDQYVYDDSKKDQLHGQSALREKFEKLPQNLQNTINAQQALFSEVKSYTEDQKTQQIEVLKFAEKILGTSEGEPSFGNDERLDINGKTSRALRNYLEEVQKSTKLRQEFEPRIFDKNSKEALDELVRTRVMEAGVKPNEINDLMIHLYNVERDNDPLFYGASAKDRTQIEALGKAVVMSNLMNLIVAGHTPSSENGKPNGFEADAKINWDKPWTTHNSGDMFFSKKVYNTLLEEKNTKGEVHLTTGILFRESDYREDQYKILKEAAEKALNISPESPDREISETDIGKIAIEIMKIRAEQVWCLEHKGEEFDTKQIHAMIHNKEFMPHHNDLKLVDSGFGFPDNVYIDVRTNEFASKPNQPSDYIGSLKQVAEAMGPNSYNLEYNYVKPVIEHRVARFTDTFGEMPEEARYKMGRIVNPNLVDGVAGTPALYYTPTRSIFDRMKPTQYEIDRQEYLKRVQTVIEDGKCIPENDCKNEEDDCNVLKQKLTVDFKEAGNQIGTSTDECVGKNKDDCCGLTMIEAAKRCPNQFLIGGNPNNIEVSPKEAEDALKERKADTVFELKGMSAP
jgi:hypothetical protein